jgi:hypothetical protein
VTEAARPIEWPLALRRYLALSLGFHLVWEIVQLPLFTIVAQPWPEQAFAVLHCTLGDGMIAGLSLLVALGLLASPRWPQVTLRRTWLLTVALAVAYTIYSEWLNVYVRGSWTYGPLMPTLPGLKTGLSPLLQWVVVPTLALRFATKRLPWSLDDSTRGTR